MAADQHVVGPRLGHAGGDRPDPRLAHQLDADPGVGVGRLQVVDQLSEVLDGVDVVVRRRRDQLLAGLRVAEPRDQLGHLQAGKLTALARLGALGDLDLQLLGTLQVGGRDAEARRGHLLDLVVPARPFHHVEVGIFTALAGVRPGADPVHGDREGLVRLRREGAERHRG